MKKYLIRIVIFFALVAVVDFSLGEVFHHWQARAGGRTGAEYYVCEKATEDVIIMGSSRASHHYVSEIISENLGMSCFNAGQDGNGIIMQYGRWIMISNRYTPRVLIYDITSDFDLVENSNFAFIDRLRPFYGDSSVLHYVSSLFPMERKKSVSRMYRFNYKYLEFLYDYIRRKDYLINRGYLPLNGNIRQEIIDREENVKLLSMKTDSVKLCFLEKLVMEAKARGVFVVFVVSPSWKGGVYEIDAYNEIKQIADRYGVFYLNYMYSDYCNNPLYFADSYHLNDVGARLFTEDVIASIMNHLFVE